MGLFWYSSINLGFFHNSYRFHKSSKNFTLIALLILFGSLFNQPNLNIFTTILEPYLPATSVDYYPLFPWLSFVFIGIYLGHFPYYQKIFSIRIIWLEVIGRHALIIYLTHQIILFGAVSLTYYLLN